MDSKAIDTNDRNIIDLLFDWKCSEDADQAPTHLYTLQGYESIKPITIITSTFSEEFDETMCNLDVEQLLLSVNEECKYLL